MPNEQEKINAGVMNSYKLETSENHGFTKRKNRKNRQSSKYFNDYKLDFDNRN